MDSNPPAAPPPGARFQPWRGAAAGWACLFAGIGLARFGYSPLIPALVREHWFGAAAADSLAAVNLAGYALGAGLAGRYLAHRSEGFWVRTALLGAAASFLACMRPWGFLWFMIWRLEAGVAAGLLMVLGVTSVLTRTPAARRGFTGGLVFAGIGSGIVVAGGVVPVLARWGLPQAWLGLGVLVLVVTAASWSYWGPEPAPAPEPGAVAVLAASGPALRPAPHRMKFRSALTLLMAAYIASAIGYVPHSLFWVDYVARELGRGLGAGGAAYMELGAAAVVGPAVAGWLGDRFGFRRCLGWGLLIEAAAVGLPLLGTSPALLSLSAVAVGAASIGTTSLTSARAVELAPLEAQKQVWGWMTVAFSIAYAGAAGGFSLLYARTHTYQPLFAAAALVLLAGSLLAALAR